MNDLSLFIYLADIVPSITDVLEAICAVIFLVYTFTFIGTAMLTEVGWSTFTADKGFVTIFNKCKEYFKTVMIIITVIPLMSALIPSKEAIYLIAASEIGEEVYQSKEVQEIKSTLIKIINKYAEEH